ncbi:MAG: hypothetical protein ACD_41C00160G0002 [uncultured bacterium]|nr:MAG: hypothetical protein ACD_41C00160G0002 [uncultured bacterium]
MDDLRGQDLKVAYWYNTHRAQVRTAAYGVAIGAVSILWLVVIILGIQVWLGWDNTNRAITDLSTTQVIYDSIQAPQALVVTDTAAVSHTSDTVDVYVIVTNPNTYYAGRFSYTVTVNGTPYAYHNGSVMPESTSYLVISNLPGSSSPAASAVITETNWQRIRGPQPTVEFIPQNVALSTSEIPLVAESVATTAPADDFATPEETEPVDVPGQTISQITADLTNASAYGFRRVTVTAVIKNSAGMIEGIQQTVLSDVPSFSELPLLFTWQRRFNFNSQPSIIVETDMWDEANLILPGDN